MNIGKGLNVFYGSLFFMRPNDRGGTSVGYLVDGQERWYESPVGHAELRERYCDEATEYIRTHPLDVSPEWRSKHPL